MKQFNLFLITVLIYIFQSVSVAQWTPAGSVATPGFWPRISVVDSNVVWIAGGSGTTPKVWRTTDGGNNWKVINTTGIPF